MPPTVMGLPSHVLLIHAVVVLLPLTGALLVLCAFSATLRRRAGVLLPIAGLGSLVLVPLATSSGEALLARLPADPAIAEHAAAGDGLLPWAVALAVASLAVWFVGRRSARTAAAYEGGGPSGAALPARSPLSIGLAVLAVAAVVGTTAQVAYIGHLGATATWGYVADLPAP
jgi:hypothetical protein